MKKEILENIKFSLGVIIGLAVMPTIALGGSALVEYIYLKTGPKNIPIESKESSESLVNKVLNISADRDGKPGISFEEQAWMAKELGYNPHILEGDIIHFHPSGENTVLYSDKGNPTQTISSKTLSEFITKYRPDTTSSVNTENSESK